MKEKLKSLIDEGHSIHEIHRAVHCYIDNQIFRCESCSRRLADLEEGVVIVKCRCGARNSLI